jgi:sulfide dehydrogenase [flavocytochrome c] flavoprotein chain
MNRRLFLGQSSALFGAALGMTRFAHADLNKAQIIVVGGGYGGSTAAKYLRLLSNNTANVTLIEPNAQFISCPLSNLPWLTSLCLTTLYKKSMALKS